MLKADGILGLAPTKQGTQADLVLEELSTQGLIKASVFSMLIGDQDEESKATFGGYNASKYGDGSIQWHNLTSTHYWMLNFTGARLGSVHLNSSVRSAIVDSGTSVLLVPTSDMLLLAEYFVQFSECRFNPAIHNFLECLCSQVLFDSYPDLFISIDNVTYRLPKQSYI